MNKTKFKQCAIYTRVSTDMQAEQEFSSCEAQEEKIKSFIKSQNNWQIFKVYSDPGYTGANTSRPALQELLEDLKQNKIDVILAYKIDRLTRSPKDFYQLIEFFEQHNVSFISITERFDTSTPSGRLLRNIMLTFGQFERELASERTKDKMLERAKKGMCNGGNAPYGYKRRNKKLVINKKEAKIVQLIFETYINTSSLCRTYNLLKEKNVKNRQGKPFYKTVLGYLLRNVVYKGKIKHVDQVYQGIHQPIISEKLFELAQKIHKKKSRKFRVYKNFLFGGLINCAECGSKMTSCFTNKRPKGKLKRYYYYRCTSTQHKDWQACSTKQVSATRLEKYILENLERISLDKNYIGNLVFKLNHSSDSSSPELKKSNTPHRSGFELREVCSKFSPKSILSILQSLISTLEKRRGVERNLFVRRFIKGIVYSQENVKITLFYSENLENPDSKRDPVLLSQDRAKFIESGKESLLPPQQNKFVFATRLRR
ncbi:MAG: recombinase family protein [Candidatus Nealsonbacteria bacterium]